MTSDMGWEEDNVTIARIFRESVLYLVRTPFDEGLGRLD